MYISNIGLLQLTQAIRVMDNPISKYIHANCRPRLLIAWLLDAPVITCLSMHINLLVRVGTYSVFQSHYFLQNHIIRSLYIAYNYILYKLLHSFGLCKHALSASRLVLLFCHSLQILVIFLCHRLVILCHVVILSFVIE